MSTDSHTQSEYNNRLRVHTVQLSTDSHTESEYNKRLRVQTVQLSTDSHTESAYNNTEIVCMCRIQDFWLWIREHKAIEAHWQNAKKVSAWVHGVLNEQRSRMNMLDVERGFCMLYSMVVQHGAALLRSTAA